MPRSPSKKSSAAQAIRIRKISGSDDSLLPDFVAVEEPLEIRIDNQPLTVTMRTPGADKQLAAGFIFTEGLISSLSSIETIEPHPRNQQNILNVFLKSDVTFSPKRFMTSASCGLCGKTSISEVRRKFPRVRKTIVAREVLESLPTVLGRHQSTFDETGGLHAAAIFTLEGELLCLHEDIGRHNAVDKAIGQMFLDDRIPLSRHILMVSGRTSFEILQKALAAGIAIVAAVSAPSSLAVQFARENKQVLVGFLRQGRMNIYSCPKQVI